MADPHSGFQDLSPGEAEAFHRLVDSPDHRPARVVGVLGGAGHRPDLLRREEFQKALHQGAPFGIYIARLKFARTGEAFEEFVSDFTGAEAGVAGDEFLLVGGRRTVLPFDLLDESDDVDVGLCGGEPGSGPDQVAWVCNSVVAGLSGRSLNSSQFASVSSHNWFSPIVNCRTASR